MTGVAAASPTSAERDTPGAVVRRAADVLVRAGSSRCATSLETASGGTRIAIRGTGTYDFAAHRGELLVSLPEDAAGVPGHRPIRELLVPGALYMKNRGEGVPAGKWVRVDTTAVADGNLVTGGATDPLTAAELLRGARAVTAAGKERLDGVAVRHYRGTTDIARAADAASPAARGSLRAAARGFSVTEVPFDAYLDERGRLRMVRLSFTFSNVSVVSVTRFSGFGTPVAVRLPAAGDIYTGKIVSSGPAHTGHR
jgi:hypothetical protein